MPVSAGCRDPVLTSSEDISVIKNEFHNVKESFEEEVDEMGFCLDQYWDDSENPYTNSDTALAFEIFKKGFEASLKNRLPKSVIDSIKELP